MNLFNHGLKTVNKITVLISQKWKKKTDGSFISEPSKFEAIESTSLFRNDDFMKKLLYSADRGHTSKEDIKPATLRLFLYILFKLEKEKDTIELQYEKISKEINLHKTAISEAIDQLIKLEVIARCDGKLKTTKFDVNYSLFFNGNRIQYLEKNDSSRIRYVAVKKKN